MCWVLHPGCFVVDGCVCIHQWLWVGVVWVCREVDRLLYWAVCCWRLGWLVARSSKSNTPMFFFVRMGMFDLLLYATGQASPPHT
jgi:hypothetical protein